MEFDEFRLKSKELEELRNDWDCTHINVTPFKYQWTIKNFRNYFKESDSYLSPTFKISSVFGQTEWYLDFLSSLEGKNEVFELYLNFKSTTNKEHKVAVKCSFSMLKFWEKTHVKRVSLYKLKIGGGVGFEDYINSKALFQKKNNLVFKNNVTIVCEGCIADSGLDIFGSVQLEIPKTRMSDDFAKLLKDEKFSDVTITVSKHEFKVHKAILASRSPVFEAMFSHDMEETKTGYIIISDIEEDVFEELLRFIYTGNSLNLEKVSDRLLIAADKYDLQRLKLMCEQDLINSLSIEKAGSFYKLASIYDAKELKVLDFIKINKLDVIKSNDWKCLTQTEPDLVIEALQLLLINNS